MPSPLDWISSELAALEAANLQRRRREVTPLPGGKCNVDGQALWNFAGNDYLGLAGDPRLAEAAARAIRETGTGARASALVTGRTPWHVRLEERLARFKQAEAAILFPTGYAANVGTICALAGPGDAVFCDRLNHASLVDGCRLSRARLCVYRREGGGGGAEGTGGRGNEGIEGRGFSVFGFQFSERSRSSLLKTENRKLKTVAPSPSSPRRPDLSSSGDRLSGLKNLLERSQAFRRRLIVTDSIFSMDGDAAPIAELSVLAREYDAMLLVDDAHATGLFGERGTGLAGTGENVIAVGTLSKAVGAQGGFVTGSKELIDWLWNTARTQMFSTALSPANCAAATRAIDLIEEEPHRRTWLAAASLKVQQGLRDAGWRVPEAVVGPIIPVLIGDAEAAVALAVRLEERGLLIPAIRPPTVPHGTSRLRISLSYAHGDEGIESLLDAFVSA
jgi:8-amino-7-oxononanoate synthase